MSPRSVSSLVFLLSLTLEPSVGQDNNVCSTLRDYDFIQTSRNCWYNPDVTSDIFDTARRNGYHLETYDIVAEDGYITPIFRIRNEHPKGVVFLEHPLTSSAMVWVDKGQSSLAYILSEADYDVWLGNNRGNYLGRKHVTLSAEDRRFWNYSFHDIGVYELPAQLGFVKNATGRDDIVYVGHSMATTSSLIYASMLPEHARNTVRVFINLSPTVYFAHTTSLVLKMMTQIWDRVQVGAVLLDYSQNKRQKTLDDYDVLEILPHTKFMMMLTKMACFTLPASQKICSLMMMLAGGWTNQIKPDWLPIMMLQNPAGLSLKCLNHYMQILHSDRFQFFDYGLEKNRMYYNADVPPAYPLENISVPFYFVYGTTDSISHPKDVSRLFYDLPKYTRKYGAMRLEGFNHFDLSYGKDIRRRLYNPLVKFLNSMYN